MFNALELLFIPDIICVYCEIIPAYLMLQISLSLNNWSVTLSNCFLHHFN